MVADICIFKFLAEKTTIFSTKSVLKTISLMRNLLFFVVSLRLQGGQDHFFPKEMAITLDRYTSDPKLVKSKCVWQLYIFSAFQDNYINQIDKQGKWAHFSTTLPWSSGKTLDCCAWEPWFKTHSRLVKD